MGHKLNGFKNGSIGCLDVENGYAASRLGIRFSASHQTPTTLATGQTSWVVTTPTFGIYQTSKATRVVLTRMTLVQEGTVAGGEVFGRIAIDSANRGSAGTAVVPQCMSSEFSTTANATFAFNPTASAAGAGTRYIRTFSAEHNVSNITEIDFGDGLIIGATGSILVYTWATTTGPSWSFSFEWIEEDI